jgi:hypothetical protein
VAAPAILRSIGSLPLERIQAGTIMWRWCVRVDVPAPIGIKRFTNHDSDITFDIDGTVELWTSGVALQVGRVEQGVEFVLNPTELSFANINNTWGNWAKTPGLAIAPVYIYVVWYDDDGVTIAGTFAVWTGKIGEQSHAERSEFGLQPWLPKWGRRVLTHVVGESPMTPAPFMPKDGTEIK